MQGRVLYDVFVYTKRNAKGQDGYILEYDARSADAGAPPLLAMIKRFILRAKVRIEDVSSQYDVWASWGSDAERAWESPRAWNWAQSGAVEPAWKQEEHWPWGTEEGSLRDRRAVGMGKRTLVPQGDRRTSVHFAWLHQAHVSYSSRNV